MNKRDYENNSLFSQNVVQWIKDMILEGTIMLRDVPLPVRIASKGIYIAAFRADRNVSCKRYISDLSILCGDIHALNVGSFYEDSDKEIRDELIDLLGTYLSPLYHNYTGDERFESFKEGINEGIMRELYDRQHTYGKHLQAMLRKYKDEKHD